MKVLYVDRSCADSIWSVVTPVSTELIKGGHKVCWVRHCSPSRANRSKAPAGVEVADISVLDDAFPLAWILQFIQFIPRFRRQLKTWQPDIVHTNFTIPGMVARWIAKRHGCRVVSTQHELFGSMNRLLQWGTRITERYADVVTYVSKTVAASFKRDTHLIAVDRVRDVFGRTEEHGPCHTVIYNSINFREISELTSEVSSRDPNKVVCVGRMVPEKGQKDLVRAFAEAVLNRPALELHFFGSGPEENILKRMSEDLGIVERVTFHGWVSKQEVLKAMAGAALVVQPSDGSQEGFGLSLVEAIACGAKMLASDIPVFREVVGDGVADVSFYPVGQAADLAQAIVAMVDADGKDQRGIGLSDTLKLRYSNSANAAAYLDVYESLMGDHP